ncbi:MAG TPA: xanthine dehydrogenase molybdopterin binding subunit [Geminicoccaceae bacterium]|nr:xanthine dehydrogenase molybdopterin binding subunit [Geminicoccaceae bacterium]
MPDQVASERTVFEQIRGGVRQPQRHDSAWKHVTGEASYIDDLPERADLLHVYLGISARAHAEIAGIDLESVRQSPGVVLVLTAADVPGVNDVSPTHRDDEPLFATALVEYAGQPLFAVAARTRAQARRAARLARVEYRELPAVLDVAAARRTERLVTDPLILQRGDARAAIAGAPRRLQGRIAIGGQDHFYLEGQIALAIPGEDDEVTVYSSTQHPSEVQHMVALVLGVPSSAVTVECRRMGGAFGGKETQGNLFACVAALVAKKTGRAAKLRPDRDDDMLITGKRHDFVVDYEVGFNDDGRIQGVDMTYAARCGYSADLSGPVTDRALFHADNCYYYENVRLRSLPLKTNTVSNTAFRGFGGPQGMVAGERLIEEIAFALGKDPLEVRRLNFYGRRERNVTPYHQTVEDNIVEELVAKLADDADYGGRRQAIRAANAGSRVIRRGLALTPVKFGISFTATHYNQAGALVHVYTDGSIHLNHGGTEMGQGLYVKVAQVVAEEFQVDIDQVRITATTTGKVPNTSATAASSGADINGMAAQAAARTIKTRLIAFAAERWGVPEQQVVFLPGTVRVGNQEMPFRELVWQAYLARVSLSSTGFYRTPKIHWDRSSGRGRPFYYFAYGAAVSEVAVDILTGEYRLERVDILHDVGSSLNPAIDRGQIEGGFVQGVGWLTTEELWWDAEGRLRTHAPSTYKIPACSDRPRVFNVALLENARNREATVFRSKAIGEPPLMLAISVLHALSDAIASVADYRLCPRLDPPATPEKVLLAIERLKRAAPAPAEGIA